MRVEVRKYAVSTHRFAPLHFSPVVSPLLEELTLVFCPERVQLEAFAPRTTLRLSSPANGGGGRLRRTARVHARVYLGEARALTQLWTARALTQLGLPGFWGSRAVRLPPRAASASPCTRPPSPLLARIPRAIMRRHVRRRPLDRYWSPAERLLAARARASAPPPGVDPPPPLALPRPPSSFRSGDNAVLLGGVLLPRLCPCQSLRQLVVRHGLHDLRPTHAARPGLLAVERALLGDDDAPER